MEPLSHEIDVETRTVVITYRGQPSFAQWRQTMENILKDAAYEHGFAFIFDRTLLATPTDSDYIKQCVSFIDAHQAKLGKSRWAIVTSDLGSFGMGRMAEQLSDFERSIRTFKDFATAARWVAGGY